MSFTPESVTTSNLPLSGASQAAIVTTGATSSTPYGFVTAAQADAMVAMMNEIRTTMIAMGVWTGAA